MCSANAGDYHLRDSQSARDFEHFRAEVDYGDPNLTPIVRVNRSRRVHQRDPVIHCQPRPGSDLRFKTNR